MKRFLVRRTKVFSDLSQNIGHIFFATMFIGPIIAKQSSLYLSMYGFLISFLLWSVGVLLAKK
jgi:hypothetical protein